MQILSQSIVVIAVSLLVAQTWLCSRDPSLCLIHSVRLKPERKQTRSIPEQVLQSFCHSEPGIHARQFEKKTKSNCFGPCDEAFKDAPMPDSVIVAPRLSRLCLENPFHGFYDCVWPLVHYISLCAQAREHPQVIIHDSKTASGVLKEEWVAQAQRAFLSNIGEQFEIMQRNDIPRCVCYKNVVSFRRKTMWRPIRFDSKWMIRNSTVVSPHPSRLKQMGLELFRSAVLNHFRLDSEPLEEDADVLIYGRHDAKRRKWLNINKFEQQLRKSIEPNIHIKRWITPLQNQSDSFEAQVRQMNSAGVVIAPHGAGMANTLFCRRGTAIIEIASRMCGSKNESMSLKAAMDVNDENTWTPWHADSLELIHFAAPCWYSETGDLDFVSETKVLVRLVQVALYARQKVRQGIQNTYG